MAELRVLFDETNRRLRRAQDAMDLLDEQLRAWSTSRPYSVKTTVSDDRLSWSAVIRVHNEIDADGRGALFGRAIHDLRSALDNLAWGVVGALDAMPERTNQVQFPVLLNGADWRRVRQGAFARLPDRVAETIRSYQPFTLPDHAAGFSVAQHPLAILHRYDIMDKHRASLQAGNAVDWLSSAFEVEFEVQGSAEHNRTPLTEFVDSLETSGTIEIRQSVRDRISQVTGTYFVPYRLVVEHDSEGAVPLSSTPRELLRFVALVVGGVLDSAEAELAN